MKDILTVLVGSHAHGLALSTSDVDKRGVFVQPTTSLLKLGSVKQETRWLEGAVDDTAWELYRFLFLASKSNPSILEVFLGPILFSTDDGDELRSLFPFLWTSHAVYDAFLGYSLAQRKKFLENKDNRSAKYASAYLRTLYWGWELLNIGTFTVHIADTEVGQSVAQYKAGIYTIGEVIQTCHIWEEKLKEAYSANKNHEQNLAPVNDFLIRMRKKYWEE